MTRLTLDTIGLCAFSYRFNSFYRDEPDPFVVAMVDGLEFAMGSFSRLPIQRRLDFRGRRRLREDISIQNALVDRLIAIRQADPDQDKYTDLLQSMLTGLDRQSDQVLDPVNIRYQILTFLVAGHETTSGLLTFALYYLIHNADVLAKAYAEVDAVLGDDPASPTEDQVRQLHYIGQILNEALRLWPPAPAFNRRALEPVVLGGKYPVTPDQGVMVLVPHCIATRRSGGRTRTNLIPRTSIRKPSNSDRRMPIGRSAPGLAPASAVTSRFRRRCSR
jgi:cytochrome P450/NADPH-cytochrome P450 reductase